MILFGCLTVYIYRFNTSDQSKPEGHISDISSRHGYDIFQIYPAAMATGNISRRHGNWPVILTML